MLAVAVARHLAANITVLTFDEQGSEGNVFVGHMPSTPDTAVMIMPTGGQPQLTKAPTDLPTLQVLVRGPRFDPRPAHELAEAIYSVLACADACTLDSGGDHEVFVIGCTPAQSAPVAIGQDANQRHEYSLNFLLRVHAPTTHRPAIA